MNAPVPDHVEVELKLAIAGQDAHRIARLPLIRDSARGRARTRTMHGIYFDTPERALQRARAALRLRREGSQWVQTIKFGGSVEGGLHSRYESEKRVAGPFLDRQALAHPALEPLLNDAGLLDTLVPVFTVQFRRTTRMLSPAPDTSIELCVDVGEIRTGERSLPLCEMELELKAGSPAALIDFAQILVEQVPGRLEPASKAERGYALALGQAPAPVRARAPVFGTDASLEQVFRAIVFNCVEQLQANERGVVAGEDPEYLHQARVALRRLRSALATFDTAFPRARYAGLLDELRWLDGCLGPARDWDVFVSSTLAAVLRAFPADGGLRALAGHAADLRQDHRRIAVDALSSTRHTRLLLALTGLFLQRPWQADADSLSVQALTPRQFAQQMLARRHKKVVKRGRRHAGLDHAGLHALRIEIKKLRYAAEFVAGLYERKAAGAYLDPLARLQDLLGGLNDAATVDRLCAELRARLAGAEGESVGLLRGWAAALAEDHLASLPKAWKRFRDARPFW
ncbi:MAG: CHAD domain-containing protein [Burkholderiales bacterium]|nr:CHAD domain-containing protein [Burkholderiales bacterium]